nr:RecName: Full=Venom peptide 2; AltName: Full=BaP-2 [Brotheas amazonicus]
IWSGIQSAF